MLKLFIADIKMMLRNRQALFWAFMFPLMFTFIFGFFFGKNTSVGTVDLIDKSSSPIARGFDQAFKDSGLFKVNQTDNLEESKAKVEKGKISAVVLVPESFGDSSPEASKQISVYYDPANSQVNAALNGFISNYLTATNFKVQNALPIYSLEQIKVGTDKKLTYFDFVLAGILGMAIMNSSINGISISMTKYREDQILKRIITTPVKTWWFIVAEVLSRIILNIAQIALIILVAKLFFDAHIYGNLFVVFAISVIGAILFQLVGFVIASFAKTTDAAEGMATAIGIPMMFLAGVFFPMDSLPKWLYSIVQYLPLAPLLRIIRGVTLDGSSPFVNPLNITLVLAWIVVCLAVSIYKFRLTEE